MTASVLFLGERRENRDADKFNINNSYCVGGTGAERMLFRAHSPPYKEIIREMIKDETVRKKGLFPINT